MPQLYLNNSLFSTGNRLFKTTYPKGKKIIKLVSWINKRCFECGKFVSKHNTRKLCKECRRKRNSEIKLKFNQSISCKFYKKAYSYLQYRNLLGYYE